MKPPHFFAIAGFLLVGTQPVAADPAQVPPPAEQAPVATTAPPAVVASAVAAVQKLGEEVVLGRYEVAIQRMNPQWKQRAAARLGGMEELEKQFDGVARQMMQRGISMISFRPQGEPRSFEVWPGKKVETVDGQEVESLIFSKWMVLVPTVTRFRIMPENQRPVIVESIGFQVAISDKGAEDWTFIDGSGVTVNELRRLFITLPADLELPPITEREVP
jgi:hypothetical protein